MKNKRKKMEIFAKAREVALHDKDVGSSGVQIALLTYKIKNITNHKFEYKKDKHCIVGLKKMIGKRSRLLRYLQKSNINIYNNVVSSLGI